MKLTVPFASLIAILACVPPGFAAPTGAESRIVVPFDMVGMYAEHHVIAWFSGHAEFESVEAFVYENGHIRAILTRHDGSQIDAFNYSPSAGMNESSGRERYPAKISFELAKNGRDARLELAMPDGKPLALSYVGQGKPNAKHAGLTDPGFHASDGGLPAMYRKASSVSGSESTVTIDGTKYAIPMDKAISRPPFFTAYSAFLSDGYESLFVRTFAEKDMPAIPCIPGTASPLPAYRTDICENRITPAWNNGIAEVECIRSSSDAISSSGHAVELRFNPPFPNLAAMGKAESTSVKFEIQFEGSSAASITGSVRVERSGDSVTVTLLPEEPSWAKAARAIRYDILLADGGPRISAAMAGPR